MEKETMVEDIRNIADISGFGKKTSYEQACQTMLQTGFEWLETHKRAKLKGHTYEGIYGIFEPDSKDAKELSDVVAKSCDDCTGAMHHAVMSHLFHIWKNGIEKWKSEIKKK
jgi:hypothetical protein